MSTPTSAVLLSSSLSALHLKTDTLFFALNYEFTKTKPKGMLKRFNNRLKKHFSTERSMC